jgi:hypothetical protein
MDIPVSLQKKDQILVEIEKLQQLFKWRDNNKDTVRAFYPILEDVVIRVGAQQVTGIAIHVQKTDRANYSYKSTVYANETKEKVLILYWDRQTRQVKVEYNDLPPHIKADKAQFDDYIQTTLSIYASLMAYMEHYKEVVTEKRVSDRQVKSRKKSKSKKKVTYITKRVYSFSEDFKTGKAEPKKKKRKYTPPSEPFTVRGHWRTYKSGKRTWVPAFPKNLKAGKQPEPKTYKL